MSSSRFTHEMIARLPLQNRKEVAAQLHGTTLIGLNGVEALPHKKTLPGLPIPSESASQMDLIKWWDYEAAQRSVDPRLLMAFPLQGHRTAANGSRMKCEGMRRGTPDLFLAMKRGDRCGLWVEMKTERKGSKPTPFQLEMLQILAKDFATVVCHSTEQAQEAILAYLSLT